MNRPWTFLLLLVSGCASSPEPDPATTAAGTNRIWVQVQQGSRTLGSGTVDRNKPITIAQTEGAIDAAVASVSSKSVRDAAKTPAENLKKKVRGVRGKGISSSGDGVFRETFKAKEDGKEKTFRIDLGNAGKDNCKE